MRFKRLKYVLRITIAFGTSTWIFLTCLPAEATPPAVASATGTSKIDPAEHTTRIIFLGTGSGPFDRKFRSQPAHLMVVDGTPYLIDAGAGVVRQLIWAGYQPGQISMIFFTHLHMDHDMGLPALMSFIWMTRNYLKKNEFPSAPVQIYGPPWTKFLVRTALQFLSVPERIFRSEMTLSPAAPMFKAHDFDHNGLVYQDNKIRVTAVENTHYHFRPGSASVKAGDKSYSYRFDTPAGSVVFTGDTGPSKAVAKLAKGANVLVSEVIDEKATEAYLSSLAPLPPAAAAKLDYHMSHEHLRPEVIGKMAAKDHVGVVLLTHFTPGLDTETNMTMYTAGVRKYYDGPVIATKDLFEYDLNSR